MFPKEFEHYFFSLELIDSQGERVDYWDRTTAVYGPMLSEALKGIPS